MERTPLPYPQFVILLLVRFIEPISFSVLMPFVYFMVRDFQVTADVNQISFYAGMVESSFAVAEFLSGIPWGILSDRIGRKPVLMLGMLGTMGSMLAFGISRSLVWALVSRFMAGLLSGNVGVMKSMVTEITDHTNRGNLTIDGIWAWVHCGASHGRLSNPPCENFPRLFGDSKFLQSFPYFLPCAASALFGLLGMVLCHYFMEETLEVSKDPTTASLLSGRSRSYGSIQAPVRPDTTQLSRSTWIVIVSFTSLSLMTIMVEQLFPFWASTSPAKGGLGFDERSIGAVFAISGFALVLMQLLVYPLIQRCLGTKFLYKWVFIAYIPIVLLMPAASSTNSAFLFVAIVYGYRTCCGVTAFTSYNILLPETCSVRILGRVNGISQSLGSLARALGPSLCGYLWSWSLGNHLPFPFDYHFMFLVISAMCLITFSIVLQLEV
ncbi:hypothetical protein L0F63_003221 [Massospora cicadina]|nr:hypothetical protein L0F63_003221 [Massospora cicadina]